MVVKILVPGVTSRINRDNSRILEINGSKNPDSTLAFWIGIIIFTILFHQLTPNIIAASSISRPNWKMALIPALDANGKDHRADNDHNQRDQESITGTHPVQSSEKLCCQNLEADRRAQKSRHSKGTHCA